MSVRVCDAVWSFVLDRHGAPFTAEDAASALPQISRGSVRSQLYELARRRLIHGTTPSGDAPYTYQEAGAAPRGSWTEAWAAFERIARLPKDPDCGITSRPLVANVSYWHI